MLDALQCICIPYTERESLPCESAHTCRNTSRSTHTSKSASVLELCQQRTSSPSQAHFSPGCILQQGLRSGLESTHGAGANGAGASSITSPLGRQSKHPQAVTLRWTLHRSYMIYHHHRHHRHDAAHEHIHKNNVITKCSASFSVEPQRLNSPFLYSNSVLCASLPILCSRRC